MHDLDEIGESKQLLEPDPLKQLIYTIFSECPQWLAALMLLMLTIFAIRS